MRITKHMIAVLLQEQRKYIRSLPVYQQLLNDYSHLAYQAVLDTDPAALGMQVVTTGLVQLVKDQLPKKEGVTVNLYYNHYNELKKLVAERYDGTVGKSGSLPESNPFDCGRERVPFPQGKVLFSATAGELLPFNKDKEASVLVYAKLALAKSRILKADGMIDSAARHLEQLCQELVTLDRLMTAVPSVRILIPATWLTAPETVEKPKTSLLDPATSARLRSIVIGEPV